MNLIFNISLLTSIVVTMVSIFAIVYSNFDALTIPIMLNSAIMWLTVFQLYIIKEKYDSNNKNKK